MFDTGAGYYYPLLRNARKVGKMMRQYLATPYLSAVRTEVCSVRPVTGIAISAGGLGAAGVLEKFSDELPLLEELNEGDAGKVARI